MPDSKQNPKVMDIVHSNKVQPSASSRPLIVSNHPYMSVDPMLNEDTSANEVAGAPVLGNTGLNEAAEQEPLRDSKTQEPVVKVPSEEQTETPEAKSEVEDSQDAQIPSEIDEPKITLPVEPPLIDDEKEAAPEIATTEEDAFEEDATEPQSAAYEQEPTLSAHDEELERLIAAGTYAVPINTLRRKRRKLWLVLVATILIALVLVDVVADMGIISVPSWLPYTNLLSS
jgi:hypothetical protein